MNWFPAAGVWEDQSHSRGEEELDLIRLKQGFNIKYPPCFNLSKAEANGHQGWLALALAGWPANANGEKADVWNNQKLWEAAASRLMTQPKGFYQISKVNYLNPADVQTREAAKR